MVNLGLELWVVMSSASPRYIHTEINPITDLIYRKDFPLLKYLDDDGLPCRT